MLELTVRLIASLAVVVGLMLLLARLVGKRYGARAGAPVQVVHRQALSRSASVAVITVGSRVLVVGTTDHQVSLLTELDPEELVDAELDILDAAVDLDITTDPTTAPATAPTTAPTAVLPAVPVVLPAAPAPDAAPARAGLAALASLSSLSSLASLAQRATPRGSHRGTAAPRASAPAPRASAPAPRASAPAPRASVATPRRTPADDGALAGSVLSPQTWRQAIAAATGKAS